jgi:hypothetical protein
MASLTKSSILAVRINAATNLKNTDTGLFGDVSDPYVVAKIGNEEQRTPTIQDNLNPIWREGNLLTLQVMAEDTQLVLRVMNENNIFKDDCIGEADVDLCALPLETWCQFREKLTIQGELEFDVFFKPTMFHRRKIESMTMLYVRVNGAINLKNTDTGVLGDVSDPYVVAKVGRTEHRTPTIDDDLNPVWKDRNQFSFNLGEADTYLELEVFNENNTMRKDDTLGRFKVKLDEVPLNKWLRRREKLEEGAGAELEFDAFLKPTEIFRLRSEVAQAKKKIENLAKEAKVLAKEMQMAQYASEWLEDIAGNTKMPLSLEEREWEEAAGGRNLVIPAWIIPGGSADQRRRNQGSRQPLAVALFPSPHGEGGAPRAPRQLQVKLLGAYGLQSVMTGCAPNAYCVCEVPGKQSSRIATPVIVGTPDPDWRLTRMVQDYAPGDSLFFKVFSADPESEGALASSRRPSVGNADELLGEAGLPSAQFYPDGFDGPLELVLASSRTSGRLHVMVIPKDAG